MAVVNGTGKTGKSFQDRELAAKVRTKALNDIYAVLLEDSAVEQWTDYKKRIVEKLAGTVLPRLTEVSGVDGGAIEIQGVEIAVRK